MNRNCTIVQITDLRVDGLARETMSRLSPGIVTGSGSPVFSWKISDGLQGKCCLRVATTPEKLEQGADLWDSGWLDTGNSLALPYGGAKLSSCQRVFCKVRVELTDGRQAESEICEFTTGLLSASDWCAKWIEADGFEHLAPSPAPYFRRRFEADGRIKQALLFSSARGLLEVSLNGRRVDEHDFLPGWTDFSKEIQYTAYEVTELLQEGENCLGALLGDGWFIASYPGYRRNVYGSCPSLRLQLEIVYEDGRREQVLSDEHWRWTYGPVLASDIYDGEQYNALRESIPAAGDDSRWQPVLVLDEDGSEVPRLSRKLMPGVCRQQVLAPVAVRELSDGVRIYDFGQIVTGRIHLHFKATEMALGLRGRFRYGEVLDENGYLYNANYRSADNLDTYVAKLGENDWESHFTFHCFRYVQVEVFSIANFGLSDFEVEAVVLTSDLEYTGRFSCGCEPLNRLADNIRNSMRGNLLEIPMDCPQRDERMGWGGDAHLFFPTAMFLADGRNFYRKYLNDLRLAQREDGAVCSVAPAFDFFQFGSPGWADALPIIAWELYRRSGDLQILQENYEAVKKHLAYQQSKARGYILAGHPDHLSLASEPVDCELTGTVFFCNSARIAARMAKKLDKAADAEFFSELAERIHRAFRERFLDAAGLLRQPTQSGFAMVFRFDMLDNEAEKALNRDGFRKLIRDNGNHLDTGFIGTAYLCPSLVKAGLADCACELVLQTEYPSWLFEVEQGATTIWERWNSYYPGKGFATPLMNSFNHYANGAVGEFLFACLAGLTFWAADEEGNLAPQVHFSLVPDRRLGFAGASCETPCGKAASEWQIDGDTIHWHCLVPPNTIGSLPAYGLEHIEPGEHEFAFRIVPDGIDGNGEVAS